jgi:hypothetical protein
VKAGGKQSNRIAGISGYTENRKKVEEWNSVPVGSLARQNETANTHWL